MSTMLAAFIVNIIGAITTNVFSGLILDALNKPNPLKSLKKACSLTSKDFEQINDYTYLSLNLSSGKPEDKVCLIIDNICKEKGLPKEEELVDLLFEAWEKRKNNLDVSSATTFFIITEQEVRPIINIISNHLLNELTKIEGYRNNFIVKRLIHICGQDQLHHYITHNIDEYLSQNINEMFFQITDRKTNKIKKLIPGIPEILPRDEVATIEDQLSLGKAVVLTGEAGTGKSVIGSILVQSALEKDYLSLYWDLRDTVHVYDHTQLRNHFCLKSSFINSLQLSR